ncbi:MAG: hypothetical protein RL193_11 [Actinomycetota bacterium]
MSSNERIQSRMLPRDKFAVLSIKSTLKEALDQMTKFRLGIACMVDAEDKLVSVLTDGDLRRLLLTKQAPLAALLISPASEFGKLNPTTIQVGATADEAKNLMHDKEIWDLPVLDSENKLIGLLHRHSLS